MQRLLQDAECTDALRLSRPGQQCSSHLLLAGSGTISTGEHMSTSAAVQCVGRLPACLCRCAAHALDRTVVCHHCAARPDSALGSRWQTFPACGPLQLRFYGSSTAVLAQLVMQHSCSSAAQLPLTRPSAQPPSLVCCVLPGACAAGHPHPHGLPPAPEGVRLRSTQRQQGRQGQGRQAQPAAVPGSGSSRRGRR